MRLVLLGSGEFALPTLRYLAESDHDVVAVVTQPARPSGRGRRTAETPVYAAAVESGIPTLAPDDVNAPEVVARLRSMDVRLGVVIAFGQKLGASLLATMPAGCVNLHASLLPKYRGAAPIQWAVAGGEEKTGVTVFRIVERMDAGPILASRWTYIKPDETAGELHDRLACIGVDAVRAALELYDDGAMPPGTPQDDGQATRAPKLRKRDGWIDFARPARRVADHIRGMTPWPGATARYEARDGRWEKTIIVRARPADVPPGPSLEPGTIDERRYVAAADGFLEILEIRPSSGRIMTWRDFVNGRHVATGDMLVTPD
ncbi:MAG: methionyl-tRNA formyltransferase [Phycisphaerae bacterium]